MHKNTMLMIIVICIALLFIYMLVPVYHYNYKLINQVESFSNGLPKLFMYWEHKKGSKKRPAYLDLCLETVKKNCKNSFDIIVLDEKTINYYLQDLRPDLDEKLSIPQKTDYYRYALLEKYGGCWLDFDTIVMKDLSPIMEHLNKYDFVGGGCHFDDCTNGGHPRPFNGIMFARKNCRLMKMCLKECDRLLDEHVSLKNTYFLLGRENMWKNIDMLRKNGWDYYHIDSKCQERDSKYVKLKNHRFISKEDIDPNCIGKMFFVPIYNTAPGFPEWFKKMDREDILNGDMLISKLFRMNFAS